MSHMSMDEMIEVLARYRYNAKHDADRIKALEDELSRLRASSFVTAVPGDEYDKVKAENARLKADVEEIRKLIDKRMAPLPGRTTLEEVERICSAHLLMGITIDKIGNLNIFLEDRVERLTKAGDEMHEQANNTFQPHSLRLAMEAWETAKKGGQP
jgi:DNA repair exonuclease SbcCD ATPase subunit